MRTFKNGKNLIKKWEFVGLMEYTDIPNIMAFCLEYTVNLLPNSKISIHNGTIIPIVFRIINKKKPKSKLASKKIVKEIIETYPIFLEENKVFFDTLPIEIDRELEMSILFEKYYLLKYENNKTI